MDELTTKVLRIAFRGLQCVWAITLVAGMSYIIHTIWDEFRSSWKSGNRLVAAGLAWVAVCLAVAIIFALAKVL